MTRIVKRILFPPSQNIRGRVLCRMNENYKGICWSIVLAADHYMNRRKRNQAKPNYSLMYCGAIFILLYIVLIDCSPFSVLLVGCSVNEQLPPPCHLPARIEMAHRLSYARLNWLQKSRSLEHPSRRIRSTDEIQKTQLDIEILKNTCGLSERSMKYTMSATLSALAFRSCRVGAFSTCPTILRNGSAHYSSSPSTFRSFPQGSRLLSTVAPTTTSKIASHAEYHHPHHDEKGENDIKSDSSLYIQDPKALASLESDFLKTMRDRGFLHQCSGILELDDKLKNGGCVTAYLGFDATAESLHVGSLLQIMALRHFQKAGHRPIVLLGGGTSKVGDPTGKDESRQVLTESDVQRNIHGISKVFKLFLEFGNTKPTDAILVNNDDWLSGLKYLEFLREYGTQFTINRMLNFESVKQRLNREAPLSFLEFNYMILQAYDFLELYRRHNAILQLGGSDQWGNMISGVELGRRCEGVQLFALTSPLITKSDGTKMGKTAGGAVWLNADKLSAYDYWQFWRNTADDDVIRFLKLFTELDLEDIAKLEKLEGSDINKAKIILADEATSLLHGPQCLEHIHETIENMFKGAGTSTDSLPRVFVSTALLEGEGKGIVDIFVELGFTKGKNEARRLIAGGGAKMDGEKIANEAAVLTLEDFKGKTEIVFRAGKKRAGVVELK